MDDRENSLRLLNWLYRERGIDQTPLLISVTRSAGKSCNGLTLEEGIKLLRSGLPGGCFLWPLRPPWRSA